jgi:hypothetical protein
VAGLAPLLAAGLADLPAHGFLYAVNAELMPNSPAFWNTHERSDLPWHVPHCQEVVAHAGACVPLRLRLGSA